MPATMRLTLRTPDGERIQRETDCEHIADAMLAYPGHSLICIYNLAPQVGLVSFADGSRYAGTAPRISDAEVLTLDTRQPDLQARHHRALVPGTHPDPDCAGVYQPRCACGWRGELVTDERAAGERADYHVADATGGESPLDRAMRDA